MSTGSDGTLCKESRRLSRCHLPTARGLCAFPRRSCSIDTSPGAGSLASPASQRKDLGRSESLRVVCRPHRIFRPSDLIHGEVLGKGCFGQAIKVCQWGGVGWVLLLTTSSLTVPLGIQHRKYLDSRQPSVTPSFPGLP